MSLARAINRASRMGGRSRESAAVISWPDVSGLLLIVLVTLAGAMPLIVSDFQRAFLRGSQTAYDKIRGSETYFTGYGV
jgi:hypothetical protein